MNISYSQFCYTIARVIACFCLIVLIEKLFSLIWTVMATYPQLKHADKMGTLNFGVIMEIYTMPITFVLVYGLLGFFIWKKATTIASWLEKPEN